jgi:hypothetical protein
LQEDVQCGRATEKSSAEINTDYLFKILESEFLSWTLAIGSCIVDQHVKASQKTFHSAELIADFILSSHIEIFDKDSRRMPLLKFLLHPEQYFIRYHIGYKNIGLFAGESARGRETNALCCPVIRTLLFVNPFIVPPLRGPLRGNCRG